jgi:hypothetical protein
MMLDIAKKKRQATPAGVTKNEVPASPTLTITSGPKTAARMAEKRRRSPRNFWRDFCKKFSAEFQVNARPRAQLLNEISSHFLREIPIEILAHCGNDRHLGGPPDSAWMRTSLETLEISGSMKSVG